MLRPLNLFLLVSCTLFALTKSSGAQIVTVVGEDCDQESQLAPVGANNYVGLAVSCTVGALCAGMYPNYGGIYAKAESGLACPTDFVDNKAQSGWNLVDTINANALALDLFNAQVRGSSFAQESCSGPPIFSTNDYADVCGEDPFGGEAPEPEPVLCFYGGSREIDSEDDSCDVPSNGLS